MRLSHTTYGLCAIALFTAACSGGGGSTTPPAPTSTATPVLAVGSTAQYSGTDTVGHVYASPTGTQSNYTAAYTFAATRTITNSSSGAPGPYDVNTTTTYTTTQDPGQGVAKRSESSDVFESQSNSNAGATLTEASTKTSSTGIDETAGAAGGGPYTQVVAATTTYATPETIGVYPLVAGASIAEPIGRTIGETTSDANGGVQETATTFTTASNETVNGDGSYTTNDTLSNGETQTIVESANGSATIAATGPVYTQNDTIGVPAMGATGYTIPVTRLKQFATAGATPAPTATTVAYNATDWYPGGALPASPFQTDTITVKGPTATLPAGCSGALSEPNLVEVDTTASTLNVDGSFATTTQQRFESNAVPVCILRTVTTRAYTVNTGALSQTTTENVAQILTNLAGATTSASTRL